MTTYEQDYDTDNDHDDEDSNDSDLVRNLRKQLKEANKKSKEADDLRNRLAEYERKDAIASAGLTALNERQMKALMATHEGDITADSLKATAAELGFVEPEPEETEEQQEAAETVTRISNASRGAGQGRPGVISPETYAEWDPDRRRRFMQQYPEAFQALKRGEKVTGVNF